MSKAAITDPSKCYFVDDNHGNIDAARAQGWGHCAHFCEVGLMTMEGGKIGEIGSARKKGAGPDEGVDVVTTLEELRSVWPEIFRKE